MKVLTVNGFFKLPDDFSGNYNDAILELVKYRSNKKCISGEQNSELLPDYNKERSRQELWDTFINRPENRNFCGDMSITHYPENENTQIFIKDFEDNGKLLNR